VQHLVDQMVDARLLVSQTLEGGKGSTVEIVHESLVSGWPTLRRWLDENQDDAQLVDQLRTAARQWHTKGRDPGLLWRGDTADEAKKFRKRYKGPLSDVERSFLEEIVSYELAAQRRRRVAVVGGFIALSVIVVATMVLLVIIQRRGAEARKNAVAAEEAQQIAEKKQSEAEVAKVAAEKARADEAAQRIEADKRLAEKLAAEKAKEKVDNELVVTGKELDLSKEDLKKALEHAQRERAKAEDNEKKAEKASAIAVSAQKDAEKSADETKHLLEREKERVKALQKQIGSPAIDVLK